MAQQLTDLGQGATTSQHRAGGGVSQPMSPDASQTDTGGVPEHDEVGWGKWIAEHHKLVVLAAHAVVHHYTFFNQQDWLDRSALLEDLRAANLPTSAWERSALGRALPRLRRLARQVPATLRRRLAPKPPEP